MADDYNPLEEYVSKSLQEAYTSVDLTEPTQSAGNADAAVEIDDQPRNSSLDELGFLPPVRGDSGEGDGVFTGESGDAVLNRAEIGLFDENVGDEFAESSGCQTYDFDDDQDCDKASRGEGSSWVEAIDAVPVPTDRTFANEVDWTVVIDGRETSAPDWSGGYLDLDADVSEANSLSSDCVDPFNGIDEVEW